MAKNQIVLKVIFKNLNRIRRKNGVNYRYLPDGVSSMAGVGCCESHTKEADEQQNSFNVAKSCKEDREK